MKGTVLSALRDEKLGQEITQSLKGRRGKETAITDQEDQDPVVVQATTRQQWTDFVPYSISEQGPHIVPWQFLGAARWRTVRESTGYFIDDPTRPYHFYPVEFHFTQACWVEITWNPIDRCWDVIHPLHPHYQCKIPHLVPPTIEWGSLDGEEDTELQEPEELAPQQAPSDTTKDSEESECSGRSPTLQMHASTDLIITDLTIAAESIHIHEPMATFTIQKAQETITLPPINPATGHHFTDDKVAIHRAIAPDIRDPPSAERPMRNLRRGNDEDDDNFGGGGGGGPLQGLGGGGPLPQAHPLSKKFVGNTLIIFTGDRSKMEQFLTQWELYWGVNNNNLLMRNAYWLLHHGRDVHLTWASVDNVTTTLRVWGSKSSKSDEDLASFWWWVVTLCSR